MVKRQIVWTLIGIAALVGSAAAEDPVYFADSDLKEAVESNLWVTDPTPTDMLGLQSLTCIECGITSLTGLEYADNLQSLNLRLNDFSNLSPLSGLINLTSLQLTINGISNIGPLSGLTNLKTLDLHGNQISNISPLSGLHQLKKLVLHRNQVSSLSALSGLNTLTHLDLQRNQITSLSAISGLNNLTTLLLEYNQISSISALAGMTSLRTLDLRQNPLNQAAYDTYLPMIEANNPGIDLKYPPRTFYRVAISSTEGGAVTDPGEGEFTYGEGEVVRLKAEAAPHFVFTRWDGNYSGTDNPIVLMVDQDYTIQARFASVQETLYVDDDAADDPAPGDAAQSGPQEDGTSAHPYDAIQEAIDVARDGTHIVVRPGTYRESIDLTGKSLVLSGLDPKATDYPVIDGNGVGPVVTFADESDPNALLSGFCITGGSGDLAGAILCADACPTIANCLIVGNGAADPNGAAIYCINSTAAWVNCTLADNCGPSALHAVDSDITVVNSILWNHGDAEIIANDTSAVTVSYCDLTGGWPGLGNIDADPLFAQPGTWADPDETEDVVWTAGDYHLRSQAGRWDPAAQMWTPDEVTSPCIDGGDPSGGAAQEPVPSGGLINLGAYGGTAAASKSP